MRKQKTRLESKLLKATEKRGQESKAGMMDSQTTGSWAWSLHLCCHRMDFLLSILHLPLMVYDKYTQHTEPIKNCFWEEFPQVYNTKSRRFSDHKGLFPPPMIHVMGAYTSTSIKIFKHSACQFLLPYLKEKKAVASMGEPSHSRPYLSKGIMTAWNEFVEQGRTTLNSRQNIIMRL